MITEAVGRERRKVAAGSSDLSQVLLGRHAPTRLKSRFEAAEADSQPRGDSADGQGCISRVHQVLGLVNESTGFFSSTSFAADVDPWAESALIAKSVGNSRGFSVQNRG